MMGDNVVDVPRPQMTDVKRIEIATEYAFEALRDQAAHAGLINPASIKALMYLPDQQATRRFQLACRAVLKSLGAAIPPELES